MEEAEQTDAVDRAGMTVFLGIQLLQPARQLIRAFGSAEGIMQYVPIILVAAGGGISLCALLVGLVMVVRHGGWQAAMQHTPTGHWSLPRRLVYSGAMGLSVFLGVFVVFILARFPAGMPWSIRP